jgi:hypothetical protein
MVCAEPQYFFGSVAPTATVTRVFTLRNEGDTTFVAGPLRTACGCTVARIDRRLVGPGETAQVTVVFRAERRQGPQNLPVYLLSADSAAPVLRFYLEGRVEPAAGSR